MEQVVVDLSSLWPERHIHPHLLLRIYPWRVSVRFHQKLKFREEQGFELFLEGGHWDVGHGGDFFDGEGGAVVE